MLCNKGDKRDKRNSPGSVRGWAAGGETCSCSSVPAGMGCARDRQGNDAHPSFSVYPRDLRAAGIQPWARTELPSFPASAGFGASWAAGANVAVGAAGRSCRETLPCRGGPGAPLDP